jgi:hypothetical protein
MMQATFFSLILKGKATEQKLFLYRNFEINTYWDEWKFNKCDFSSCSFEPKPRRTTAMEILWL